MVKELDSIMYPDGGSVYAQYSKSLVLEGFWAFIVVKKSYNNNSLPIHTSRSLSTCFYNAGI